MTATWWFWLVVIGGAFAAWLIGLATVIAVWVFRANREARYGIRRGAHRPADRHPEGV